MKKNVEVDKVNVKTSSLEMKENSEISLPT